MKEKNGRRLIAKKDAANLLGLKTTQHISLMIKEEILNTYEKEGSQRKWLDYDEVFNLPKKLPKPLPDEYFPKLKVNERWEKNKKDK